MIIILTFQKLKAFVSKSSAKEETTFTVFAPPGLGYYKLVVFAARTPRNKERLYMPVVATFLVRILKSKLILNIYFHYLMKVEMRELPKRSKSRPILETSLKLSSISEKGSESVMYNTTTVTNATTSQASDLGKYNQ